VNGDGQAEMMVNIAGKSLNFTGFIF